MKQRCTRRVPSPRRGLPPAVLFALLALLALPALAQEPAPDPAAAAAETEAAAAAETAVPEAPTPDQLHDELRALRVAMETALNDRDLDALVAHVTGDVVFTTMNNDVVAGPDGIRDYFDKMLEGPDRVVDSVTSHFEADALSTLVEDDVAIAVGKSHDRYRLRGGREFEIEGRWTATMVRRDGRWLVAAFHYSTNVFDNPILAAQRKAATWIAVGLGVAMLIVGLLLGRFLARRRAG